ncbi:MAG: type II secretion system F family protein [Anaerolineae bacterium]|nr:type II secretion system F family protein [Anaerolineae bacterium]
MLLWSVPVLVAALVGLAILLVFTATWVLFRGEDPVVERLKEYGMANGGTRIQAVAAPTARYGSRLRRMAALFGLGPRLALALTQAALPLTAAEFVLIVVGLALVGFLLGTWRYNALLGAALAAAFGVVPVIYLRTKRRQRLRAFTQQLPDMLTLVIGALRAGHGLNQALELVVERLPDPMATEIQNVTRAVNLGLPLQRALEDAVGRIGSEDFNLVVVAINVQYETGGNLAETLEIISDTVRDRLQMLQEIRVLTAQQRFTGYVLAFLPVFTGLAVWFLNPDYVEELFQPGWVRILPITAVVMQVLGFLIIRKIVDIEV